MTEPTITFLQFVFSLAETIAVHLGDKDDPAAGGKRPPELLAAAQLIDILALLEQKTKGNLTAEEASILEQVIYATRLRYVEVRGQAEKRIVEP